MKHISLRSSMRPKTRSKKRKTQRKEPAPLPRTAEEFFTQPEEFRTDWEDMLRVLKRMRTERLSLKRAATEEDVNPRTVTRLGRQAIRKRANRSYAVTKRDSLLRVMVIPTSEGMREVSLRDSRHASLVARYSDAVQKYFRTGDASGLKKFKSRFVMDASGAKVFLLTDLADLDRLGSAGVLSFESLYARTA